MTARMALGGIAALAFITACVAHEVAGHAAACLMLGGHVTLLTSVYFRGVGAGPLVDAAGPLMNLAAGLACLAAARTRPEGSPSRLFFGLAMIINLSWCAGCFLESAVTGHGDWGYVLSRLGLEPRWLWRIGLGAAAAVLYSVVESYFVAAAVCCASVLFYSGPLGHALREAVIEGFGTPLALLFLAYRRRRRPLESRGAFQPVQSRGWVVASIIVTALFFVTLGRGWAAIPPG
jgi:hypothetical protein